MLSGDLAVEQAPIFDCLSFDPFTLFDDGLCTSEVDVGGCDVADALVTTAMIVMLDEGLDLTLEIAGQEVVLEQDAVLEGLMPSLDLPWVCGCSGAPRIWLMPLASIHSASSAAM